MKPPPHALLAGSAGALVALLLLAPPIAQPPSYHDFADQRACFGLPNCLNTASNLLFVLAGSHGLHCLRRLSGEAAGQAFVDARERWPYTVFFVAVILIGGASAAYHLAPDNTGLAWDRAAMALAFMAWLAAMIAERVAVRTALALLAPLCLAGLGAVGLWAWSEAQGAGDLRPWLLIQLAALLLPPLLLWQYPPRYSHGRDMAVVIALYVLALMLDLGDRALFALTDGMVGGHALKHAAAALATWQLARHLRRRRPL